MKLCCDGHFQCLQCGRLKHQTALGNLPALEGIEHEARIVEQVLDDVWHVELPRLIRDPFLTDIQHMEVCRRLPFIILDLAIRFFVVFLKRAALQTTNAVFSVKGLLIW